MHRNACSLVIRLAFTAMSSCLVNCIESRSIGGVLSGSILFFIASSGVIPITLPLVVAITRCIGTCDGSSRSCLSVSQSVVKAGACDGVVSESGTNFSAASADGVIIIRLKYSYDFFLVASLAGLQENARAFFCALVKQGFPGILQVIQ